MTSTGTVRVWHAEEGWGVIDSEATPGGCWAHYSALLVPGYKMMRAGDRVAFRYEAGPQDGYDCRATEVWPVDEEPVRTYPDSSGSSPAYQSTLTLTFDTEAQPGD